MSPGAAAACIAAIAGGLAAVVSEPGSDWQWYGLVTAGAGAAWLFWRWLNAFWRPPS